jgi:hypothetical protein
VALKGLRQGLDAIKSSGKGKWTPFLSWKDGESKTIAFLHPAENIAKVKIHNFVTIPDDSKRGFHYETFICRKDPFLAEESGNTCPLCDEIGHTATEKCVSLATELEPVMKAGTPHIQRLDLKMRSYERQDGTTVEVPVWGLMIQSFGNFFNFFTAFAGKYGDIQGIGFDIARMGNDKHTTYSISAIQNIDVPSLSGFEFPTLEDVLTNLGSLEKYQDLAGVEPGSQTDFEGSGTTEIQEPASNARQRTKFEELAANLPGNAAAAEDVSVESY